MADVMQLAKQVLGFIPKTWNDAMGTVTFSSDHGIKSPVQASQFGHPTGGVSKPAVLGDSQTNPQNQIQFGGQYPNAEKELATFYQNTGNPPMSQFQPEIIAAARKYGIDPRVVPLIAQIESSGGKNYPQDSYNPFGYLGGDGNTVEDKLHAGFTSLPMAIDRMTNRFANKYPALHDKPTFENLQAVYNANPAEQKQYLANMQKLLPMFQNQ